MRLPALKTLRWVKQRRLDALDTEVSAQAQVVASSQAGLAQARDDEAASRQAEQAGRDAIDALTSAPQGFLPSALLLQQHLLQALVTRTAQAVKATEAAQQQLDQAGQQLLRLKQARQRVSHQLEQLAERERLLRQTLDQQAEDAQDEASEEAAVARAVTARMAHRRAAALAQA